MQTTVTTDDQALADKVQAVDGPLRQNYAGLDIEDFIPEVERSLTELGLELPVSTVREYAQHISDRADYALVLTSRE